MQDGDYHLHLQMRKLSLKEDSRARIRPNDFDCKTPTFSCPLCLLPGFLLLSSGGVPAPGMLPAGGYWVLPREPGHFMWWWGWSLGHVRRSVFRPLRS